MADDNHLLVRASIQDELSGPLEDIREELADVGDEAETAGKKASRSSSGWGRLTGGLGKLVKTAGKAAIGIGAAGLAGAIGLAGVALKKGFSRLTSLENATAKLEGLGHSGKNIKAIMDNALAAVKGTAFGMDEAAGAAATLAAAGIKPGERMEKTLRLMADSATIAGTDLTDMGALWGKVAAKGSLDGEVMAQLLERQIGILPALAKHYNVTAAEASKMVSEGKVSFNDFAAVMETTLGGAAEKSGAILEGAWKNLNASLGRIGANLLGGVYPQIKTAINGAMGLLSGFEDKAAVAGAWIGNKLAGAAAWVQSAFQTYGPRVVTVLASIRDGAVDLYERFGPGLMTRLETIRDVAVKIGSAIMDNLVPAIRDVWETHGPGLLDFAQQASEKFDALLMPAIEKVGGFIADTLVPAVSDLIGWLSDNNEILIVAAAVVGAYKTALLIMTGVTKGVAIATGVWTGAQKLLNIVLSLNPIGVVIAVIAGLVAAVVLAYKKSDTFRGIVDGLWAAIKTAGKWIMDTAGKVGKFLLKWTPMGRAITLVKDNFDLVKGAIKSVIDWLGKIKVPQALKDAAELVGKVGDKIGDGAAWVGSKIGLGDTATSRARGGNLGSTLAAHAGAVAATGARPTITNALVGGGGHGHGSGDHQNGRALDLQGRGLAAYGRHIRAMGGYAAFHGTGRGRHLHAVPAASGDTATSRARSTRRTGGVSGGVHIAEGAVVVTVNNPASNVEVAQAVAQGIRDYVREREERG